MNACLLLATADEEGNEVGNCSHAQNLISAPKLDFDYGGGAGSGHEEEAISIVGL